MEIGRGAKEGRARCQGSAEMIFSLYSPGVHAKLLENSMTMMCPFLDQSHNKWTRDHVRRCSLKISIALRPNSLWVLTYLPEAGFYRDRDSG